MGETKDDARPANDMQANVSVEVLGTVKRVIRRPVTPADRADIDAQLHALIDARAGNERQQKRAQKSLAKLRKRGAHIEEQVNDLHSKWQQPTVEEIAMCRVERTATEIRIVRDNGEPIYARPLTKDERVQLDSRLPNMENAATIRHPELDANDEVAQIEKTQAEARKTRDELTKGLTFEQAIAEVDAEEAAEISDDEGEGQVEEKPKKKGKKAKKGEQLEMKEAGGKDAVH